MNSKKEENKLGHKILTGIKEREGLEFQSVRQADISALWAKTAECVKQMPHKVDTEGFGSVAFGLQPSEKSGWEGRNVTFLFPDLTL